MIGILSLLLGIARAWLAWRTSAAGRPVSLRQARRSARRMAVMMEHSVVTGGARREKIVAALIGQDVPEPLARICAEEAAARFSLRA